MIEVSTNCGDFWNNKEEDSLLMLYAACDTAEIILDLSKRAGIKIECFIDRDKAKSGHYFCGTVIYSPEEVNKKYEGKKIKIFVTSPDISAPIRLLSKTIDSAKVYIPGEENGLNAINIAVAPLRNKLIKNKDFSIIANTCAGTRMHLLLDSQYQSPFVSLIVEPENFLKICSNLKEYLNEDLKFLRLEEWIYSNSCHTLCSLGDVELKFIGRLDFESIKSDWQKRIERVNYDNLFFIMEDTHYHLNKPLLEKFNSISNGRKLILQRKSNIFVNHSIYNEKNTVFTPNVLVEEWFGIIDFINKDAEY